jgi:hypothetical protein
MKRLLRNCCNTKSIRTIFYNFTIVGNAAVEVPVVKWHPEQWAKEMSNTIWSISSELIGLLFHQLWLNYTHEVLKENSLILHTHRTFSSPTFNSLAICVHCAMNSQSWRDVPNIVCNRQVLRSNWDWDHPQTLKVGCICLGPKFFKQKNTYTCQKNCLRGSQAGILGLRPPQKQVWCLSPSWSFENGHIHEVQDFWKPSSLTGHCSISPQGGRPI